MGIVLGGRGRKRRRIGRADGRSINVYTMHPIRILFQAAFFGGLPRFRFTGRSEVPPSPAFSGEAGLGFFGGLPLLRFAGGSPVEVSSWVFLGCEDEKEERKGGKRTHFRRPPPFPLLASRWRSFGCRRGRIRRALLVLAALGTTTPSFHG
jgi:hypothetical protein